MKRMLFRLEGVKPDSGNALILWTSFRVMLASKHLFPRKPRFSQNWKIVHAEDSLAHCLLASWVLLDKVLFQAASLLLGNISLETFLQQ